MSQSLMQAGVGTAIPKPPPRQERSSHPPASPRQLLVPQPRSSSAAHPRAPCCHRLARPPTSEAPLTPPPSPPPSRLDRPPPHPQPAPRLGLRAYPWPPRRARAGGYSSVIALGPAPPARRAGIGGAAMAGSAGSGSRDPKRDVCR
jgi:hypothetical protein